MVLPLIPLIMAAASLGLGVAQGVSSVKQTNEQIEANDEQTRAAMKERAKQAKKLMQEQETSFLKSGVYFEGTPDAVINETASTAKSDMQSMENDAVNQQTLLKRQGKTAFYSAMINAITGAATSYVGLGGTLGAAGKAATASNAIKTVSNSQVGTNVQNWYSNLRGWNKGSFDNSTV